MIHKDLLEFDSITYRDIDKIDRIDIAGDSLSYKTNQQRPSVVTTAQVIMWIQAGLSLIAACSFGALSSEVSRELSSLFVVLVAVYIFNAVLVTVVVINIMNRRRWARITAIVLEVLAILGLFVNAGTQTPVATIIGLGVAITLLVCLFHEKAVAWCDQ